MSATGDEGTTQISSCDGSLADLPDERVIPISATAAPGCLAIWHRDKVSGGSLMAGAGGGDEGDGERRRRKKAREGWREDEEGRGNQIEAEWQATDVLKERRRMEGIRRLSVVTVAAAAVSASVASSFSDAVSQGFHVVTQAARK